MSIKRDLVGVILVNPLLIISLIVNLVLLLLVFFKSALNEIVKEWWLYKRKAKREKREKLIALRSYILEIGHLSNMVLFGLASLKVVTDEETKQFNEKYSDDSRKKWGEIRQKISDEEIHYPIELRNDIGSFITDIQGLIAQILKEPITYKEDLLEITQTIDDSQKQLIGKIEELI